MPYSLKKQYNKPFFWVIDNMGKKLEKDPIPLERAKRQIIAIYLSKRRLNKKRSDTSIKKEVFG